MKIKVLKNYKATTNYFGYNEGEIIEAIEIYGADSYGIYHNLEFYTILDFIPKSIVEIL